jgi:hypothetical protein
MPDLGQIKVTPLVPKFVSKLTNDEYKKQIALHFARLQMGLNDLKLLIDEYIEQY